MRGEGRSQLVNKRGVNLLYKRAQTISMWLKDDLSSHEKVQFNALIDNYPNTNDLFSVMNNYQKEILAKNNKVLNELVEKILLKEVSLWNNKLEEKYKQIDVSCFFHRKGSQWYREEKILLNGLRKSFYKKLKTEPQDLEEVKKLLSFENDVCEILLKAKKIGPRGKSILEHMDQNPEEGLQALKIQENEKVKEIIEEVVIDKLIAIQENGLRKLSELLGISKDHSDKVFVFRRERGPTKMHLINLDNRYVTYCGISRGSYFRSQGRVPLKGKWTYPGRAYKRCRTCELQMPDNYFSKKEDSPEYNVFNEELRQVIKDKYQKALQASSHAAEAPQLQEIDQIIEQINEENQAKIIDSIYEDFSYSSNLATRLPAKASVNKKLNEDEIKRVLALFLADYKNNKKAQNTLTRFVLQVTNNKS